MVVWYMWFISMIHICVPRLYTDMAFIKGNDLMPDSKSEVLIDSRARPPFEFLTMILKTVHDSQ